MEGGENVAVKLAAAGGCEAREKRVLVTVGTTSFDELIEAVTSSQFIKLLMSQGYTRLSLQIGRGQYIPDSSPTPLGFVMSWFRYKPTLASDMQNATLIISHGGSGSILEALSLEKMLVVVVNENLMGNHQTELAEQMETMGVLLHTTPKGLYSTVKKLPSTKFAKYEQGQPQKLGEEIDKIMGFA